MSVESTLKDAAFHRALNDLRRAKTQMSKALAALEDLARDEMTPPEQLELDLRLPDGTPCV